VLSLELAYSPKNGSLVEKEPDKIIKIYSIRQPEKSLYKRRGLRLKNVKSLVRG
jgi:hypothetical protein